MPYPFPRDIGLMAQYALNLRPEANLHWSALPRIAPWLYRYWRPPRPRRSPHTARAAPAAGGALHRRARGADGGCRHPRHDAAHGLSALLSLGRGAGRPSSPRTRATAGLRRQLPSRSTAAKLAELEPHLRGADRRRRPDARARQRGRSRRGREGLCAAVRGARRALRGGRCAHAVEAARRLAGARPAKGPVTAGAVVVALGPWSDDVFRPLGLSLPVRRQARLSHAFHGAKATPR